MNRIQVTETIPNKRPFKISKYEFLANDITIFYLTKKITTTILLKVFRKIIFIVRITYMEHNSEFSTVALKAIIVL
jgi:hypothetical protein